MYKARTLQPLYNTHKTTKFHILAWYQSSNIGDSIHTLSVTTNNQPT